MPALPTSSCGGRLGFGSRDAACAGGGSPGAAGVALGPRPRCRKVACERRAASPPPSGLAEQLRRRGGGPLLRAPGDAHDGPVSSALVDALDDGDCRMRPGRVPAACRKGQAEAEARRCPLAVDASLRPPSAPACAVGGLPACASRRAAVTSRSQAGRHRHRLDLAAPAPPGDVKPSPGGGAMAFRARLAPDRLAAGWSGRTTASAAARATTVDDAPASDKVRHLLEAPRGVPHAPRAALLSTRRCSPAPPTRCFPSPACSASTRDGPSRFAPMDVALFDRPARRSSSRAARVSVGDVAFSLRVAAVFRPRALPFAGGAYRIMAAARPRRRTGKRVRWTIEARLSPMALRPVRSRVPRAALRTGW